MKTQYIKKSIVLAVLSVFALIPALSFASVDADLRYGSKGQEVTELQEFLIDKGFLQGQASGNFYSLTRKAVIAYQASVSLPATGFVGPMTRGVINDDLAKNTSPEEVASTPVVTPSVDTVAIQAKIDSLVAQIAQMNADAKATAQIQQAKTDQQTQLFGQIVQNTTPVVAPVVVPAAPVVPQVSKELRFGYISPSTTAYEVKVLYFENNQKKCDVPVTLSVNDQGHFDIDRFVTEISKNTVIIKTKCYDNRAEVEAVYSPSSTTTRLVFTASAEGITATSTVGN